MAVGRISGPLLKQNLLREGVDLAFETDLLYLDVNNSRVGINTSDPQYELDVNGTLRTPLFEATGDLQIADITVSGNTISTTQPTLRLGTNDNVIYQNRLTIDSLDIEGNRIRSNDSNANIELRPNGTGTVQVHSNLFVDGNINATGNVFADGEIIIGDADTDFIEFNAEIASDLIPDADNTYQLGSDPDSGGQQWADVYVNNFVAGTITSNALTVDGIDLTLRQGNIFYVSENGSDSRTGTHPQDPFGSIGYAISQATDGDTVFITPGVYEEEFPISVPTGVTVRGQGIRSVTIRPTTETRYNDAFLLNGQTTVEDVTITGFYSGGNFYDVVTSGSGTVRINVGDAPFAHTYVSGGTIDISGYGEADITNAVYNHLTGDVDITHTGPAAAGTVFIKDLVFSCNGGTRTFPDNGYAFRFDTNFEVTSRSPYIRNITVITTGSTTTSEDPRGYNAGDAGKGAYADGAYATLSSREAGMLFHSVTFITPGVDALTATNGARIEWLNCFTYFAKKGLSAFDSNDGIRGAGQTAFRVNDLTGTFADGETVEYYDTDGVTLLASGTINGKNADGKFFIDGKATGFEEATERQGKIITANGNAGLETSKKKFGSASLALHFTGDSASLTAQNDFGFGTGDFTVETWIYADANLGTDQAVFDFRAGVASDIAPYIYINSGNIYYYTDSSVRITGASAITAKTWHHIALSRSGTDTKLFVDGTQVGSTYTDNNNYGVAKPLKIGSAFDDTLTLIGNFDDVRIQKGEALYTGAFTAPITTLYANANTVLLVRFNGDDSSVVFTDEVVYAQDIRFSGGATATQFDLVDFTDFGAEVRMIGSACVYGQYGLYGDGPGVIVYAIGQNLAYIGNGKEVTNDPTTVVQENEVVNNNGSKIRFNSVDHRGDFRVGDLFYVNQSTGQVTFTAANFNVDADQGLTLTDGVNTTTITSTKIDTGNLRISGNTIESLTGDVNFEASSDQINLNNNVNIDGNLDVTGDVTIGGNITIGDEVTDTVEFIAGINSNIIPAQNSTYAIGSPSLLWKNIYANEINIDDIKISNNFITSTTSNSNVELRANGTGFIVIDDLSFDNYTISSSEDIILEPSSQYVKVNTSGAIKIPTGDTVSRPTNERGLLRYNTDLERYEGYNGTYWINLKGVQDIDGDTRITAELTEGANDNIIRFYIQDTPVVDINDSRLQTPRLTVDDIEIDDNYIATVVTNQDLEFKANGTGSVLLENFAFTENTITNTVTDSITLFDNTGDGYVKINGTNGFVLPVGDNTNRPDPAFTEIGMLRFNSADGRVEAYDGQQWGSVAGATGAITTIEAGFLAVETVLYLG